MDNEELTAVREIAACVLDRVSPEELPLLDPNLEQIRLRGPDFLKDFPTDSGTLGIGLEGTITALLPALLLVLTEFVNKLAKSAGEDWAKDLWKWLRSTDAEAMDSTAPIEIKNLTSAFERRLRAIGTTPEDIRRAAECLRSALRARHQALEKLRTHR